MPSHALSRAEVQRCKSSDVGTYVNASSIQSTARHDRQVHGGRYSGGTHGRYRGSNGSNSAQFSHPQGSTLTFQHNVGVSYETGLRHGVTMHPRGRHLREGMILPPHGTYTHEAREQQQPLHNNHNNDGDGDTRSLTTSSMKKCEGCKTRDGYLDASFTDQQLKRVSDANRKPG